MYTFLSQVEEKASVRGIAGYCQCDALPIRKSKGGRNKHPSRSLEDERDRLLPRDLWRVGGSLTNPVLYYDGERLRIISQGESDREEILEIDVVSGNVKSIRGAQGNPPLHLTELEWDSCAGLDEGGLQVSATAKSKLGPSCGRIEIDNHPIALVGMDPGSRKELWRFAFDTRLPCKIGRIYVWKLPSGDLFVVAEPLLFEATAGDVEWAIKKPAPGEVLKQVSCAMIRVTRGGNVAWETSPTVERLRGAYGGGVEVYGLENGVIVRCADWLYRVELTTGRILWEFDAGYSVQNEPVGDEHALFYVQRSAPRCLQDWGGGLLCPW